LEPAADDAAILGIDPQILLPADYREFLATAGTHGAGPGYGLVPPVDVCGFHGLFPASHDWAPNMADPAEASVVNGMGGDYYTDWWLRGTVPLVDWGCGIVSVLLVTAPEPVRGAVFLDVRWAGLGIRQTHPSFRAFYEGWLSAVEASAVPPTSAAPANSAGPLGCGVHVPVPQGTCANWNALDNFLASEAAQRGLAADMLTDTMLVQILQQIPDGGIAQGVDEDSAYYRAGDRLRPCPACTARIAGYVEHGAMRWSLLAPGVALRSLRDWDARRP